MSEDMETGKRTDCADDTYCIHFFYREKKTFESNRIEPIDIVDEKLEDANIKYKTLLKSKEGGTQ